jgi:MFS family permease
MIPAIPHDIEKGALSRSTADHKSACKIPDFEKDAVSDAESEAIESPILDGSSHHEPLSRHASATSRKSATATALSRIASRLATASLPEPGPPPDGGLTAWTQCFLTWLVVFNTWGFVNSFGAFQTYYSSTLNLPQSTISWIGSTQAFLMFFLGAFSGRAFDAGLLRPVIILGIIVQLVGMFCMSLSTKYWQLFVTQGVLTGIGGGIFFCPSMGLLSTYFSKHRGIAVGISTTGNSTGGIIFPLIVRQLLPKVGFAWTVRVLGFVNLASLVVVVAFMKPRLRPRKAGPIIEWTAIRDVPYVLFVLGVCFLMAGVYFVFYYVRQMPLPVPSHHIPTHY